MEQLSVNLRWLRRETMPFTVPRWLHFICLVFWWGTWPGTHHVNKAFSSSLVRSEVCVTTWPDVNVGTLKQNGSGFEMHC